jgi:GntR family transcriptional regulator
VFDQLDPGSPTPLYEQIARRVRAAIAAGEVRPGSALPSVRQLATDLRVNPATVSQAYRQLESDGFVASRRGAGTFVKALSTDRREAESRAQARTLARQLLSEALRIGVPGQELLEALQEELATHPRQADSERKFEVTRHG